MKIYCHKVRLNQGGYTDTGTYFGIGMPLYLFETEDGDISEYVRAYSRNDAIALIKVKYGLFVPKEFPTKEDFVKKYCHA
jgi:hypothetical protein